MLKEEEMMKYLNRFAGLFLLFAIAVLSVPIVFPKDVFGGGSLTPTENSVIALVNGSRAYSYDMQLENIALSHYAFRAAGSAGANEAADWIADQFESFGLEVGKEEFQFTTWDLLSKPTLVIDDDGNFATTGDQKTIESFQSAHYSLPGDVFADLVVLPLPPATNRDEIGATPIGTLWSAVDITGKALLIGREVRLDEAWEETYKNKLGAQSPAAVIYTWWYDWMSFVSDFFSSAGGRPISSFGCYYWDLDIPVGFVSYDDSLWIRSRESSIDVYAKVVIDSVVDVGPHYNVVGKLTGYGEPEKFVIVSGHYDTVMCAGFCDNGAGTSGVIELARVFTKAVGRGLYYPKFTILFVALASEEIGCVGSINYVMQHEAQMGDIVAVINLDGIGSDNLHVSETNPTDGFDLDELVLEAASDIGISATLEEPGGSDQEVFRVPAWGNGGYLWIWGLNAGIDDATPVESSTLLISFPLVYTDKWDMGTPGWIHTSYDNSTSTETLNWVEADDLEDHIKVAALTVMLVSPSCSYASVRTATGTGNVTFVSSVGTLQDLVVIDENTLPTAGKPDLVFPHGFFSFKVDGFTPGQTVTITVTLPSSMPVGTQYWKCQGDVWYPIPIDDDEEDNVVTFQLTDGGLGDADGTANGVIIDPGGPGSYTYILGDVNSDGIVDIYDVVTVSIAFGSKPGDSNWNQTADLNNDDAVDIYDVVLLAQNFGKTA